MSCERSNTCGSKIGQNIAFVLLKQFKCDSFKKLNLKKYEKKNKKKTGTADDMQTKQTTLCLQQMTTGLATTVTGVTNLLPWNVWRAKTQKYMNDCIDLEISL